jgi:hypothetical protein
MSIAVAVFAILSAAVTALGSLASLLWWAYRRGEAVGEAKADSHAARAEDKARIEDFRRQLAETRVELAALQPRPHAPSPGPDVAASGPREAVIPFDPYMSALCRNQANGKIRSAGPSARFRPMFAFSGKSAG